ncbi:MAG: hypothetical protein IPG56_18890 [Caulobacteraceae bacterium]|nr:hypothetical protein [Caulobacteraceae bacterium]
MQRDGLIFNRLFLNRLDVNIDSPLPLYVRRAQPRQLGSIKIVQLTAAICAICASRVRPCAPAPLKRPLQFGDAAIADFQQTLRWRGASKFESRVQSAHRR